MLDEAEDGGWVTRNVARGRRMREPVERRRTDMLEPDEFLSLLEAAGDLYRRRHTPASLERAETIRTLRDELRMPWKEIAARVGVAPTTAMYLYRCEPASGPLACGPRRAVVATLGLAGLRVTELCGLRAGCDEPPILAHVTPHTFRRTYISFMLAPGFDMP